MRVLSTHRAISPITSFGIVDKLMDEFFNNSYASPGSTGSQSTIASIIKRPHNLLTVTDKNGDVAKYILEIVYTPFKKEDVNISIEDNVLQFNCDKDTKDEKTKDGSSYVYRGISSQGFSFSLPFIEDIDVDKIEAIAEEGVVRITFPIAESSKPVRKNITLK
jgi:HSP20 family molecular chaperone IbpA